VPPSWNFYRNSYRDYSEWNPKDRRDGRADDENERVPGIEEQFDAAIRNRFGLLISRAARS
jgi:hypothetical protein